MITKLLNKRICDCIIKSGKKPRELFEIRLRTGRPLVVCDRYGSHIVKDSVLNGRSYITAAEDIEYTLGVASGHSVYAVSEQLLNGYISFDGGIRIGVAGEGVVDGGKLTALKNISSLNIRIPHEVKGCADGIKYIVSGGLKNILILSPPGAGKTTLLRELTRLYSDKAYNILLIDERNEIAAVAEGRGALDTGEFTDIMSGIGKHIVYGNVIRSMRPDMIVTDELFGAEDVESIRDIIRSGVRVMASLHAASLDAIKDTVFGKLLGIFDYYILLESPGVMRVVSPPP
ncbi:MAG: Flp pilus assembly complex ATPase component TadA [Clostridiales bacterium]|jgi:stage III sporulation protein AA|nr:Flp pilus assembly complex ATPase component TadA [Clostridiales bacterium]